MINGGKVIDSGGFGCIFLPHIICNKVKKGKDKKNKTKKITKMMLNRYASDEYNEIMKIKDLVKKIDNYENYFVVKNIELCKIKSLSDIDLEQFEKCTALQKYDITRKNIRQNFEKISIVNIPYAGITIEKFIETNYSISKFIHLNKLLINLLNKAIIPMNRMGVYHSDLKGSNMLINDSHKNVRLIDWGLTVVHRNKYFNTIPNKWKNRPFQFNVPFEIILLSDSFIDQFGKFLENIDTVNNTYQTNLFDFVNNFVYIWLNERGKGHISYIHNIFSMLKIVSVVGKESNNESPDSDLTEIDTASNLSSLRKTFSKYKLSIDFISHYLVFILKNHTDTNEDGNFTLITYMNNIFRHKTDIWGFVISYLPIFEVLNNNKNKLNDGDRLLHTLLADLLINNLYTPKATQLDIPSINKQLLSISDRLSQFKNSTFNTKNIKSHLNSLESPATIL